MMNVYDTANKLAYEIRCTEEYTVFKEMRKDIKLNSELYKKITEFEQLRYKEQLDTMKNGKTDEQQLNEIKKKYAELLNNEMARKYFDAELKFNMLIADVNKIIADSVKEMYN